MTDITPRLRSIRERVAALAELTSVTRDETARRLIAELAEELDRAIAETSTDGTARPRPTGPRHLRDEVVKCPRCALRGFTFQKGTVREAADGARGFEAFYRCVSCGHEAWREIT